MAWFTRGVRSRAESDRTFGLAMTAMLLVTPIAWDHYLLLLLVPLAVAWRDLPPSWWARGAFLAIAAALWLSPAVLWTATGVGGRVARPIDAVTVLSLQTYALVGLFALGAWEYVRGPSGPETRAG